MKRFSRERAWHNWRDTLFESFFTLINNYSKFYLNSVVEIILLCMKPKSYIDRLHKIHTNLTNLIW